RLCGPGRALAGSGRGDGGGRGQLRRRKSGGRYFAPGRRLYKGGFENDVFGQVNYFNRGIFSFWNFCPRVRITPVPNGRSCRGPGREIRCSGWEELGGRWQRRDRLGESRTETARGSLAKNRAGMEGPLQDSVRIFPLRIPGGSIFFLRGRQGIVQGS